MNMLKKYLQCKNDGYDILALSIADELYQYYIAKRIDEHDFNIICEYVYEYISTTNPEGSIFDIVVHIMKSLNYGLYTTEVLQDAIKSMKENNNE